VTVVLYQIYPLQKGHYVGHAFMYLRLKVYGHYPDPTKGNKGFGGAGRNNPEEWDDENLKYCENPQNPLRCIKKTITMCASSSKKLDEIVMRSLNDNYCIFNPKGAPTCKGWVGKVMDEAGFQSDFTRGWVPSFGDSNQ
jgi:hypothetical protein